MVPCALSHIAQRTSYASISHQMSSQWLPPLGVSVDIGTGEMVKVKTVADKTTSDESKIKNKGKQVPDLHGVDKVDNRSGKMVVVVVSGSDDEFQTHVNYRYKNVTLHGNLSIMLLWTDCIDHTILLLLIKCSSSFVRLVSVISIIVYSCIAPQKMYPDISIILLQTGPLDNNYIAGIDPAVFLFLSE